MVMVSVHSPRSPTKDVIYFNFVLIGDIALKKQPIVDGALQLRFDEPIDVADIIIRLQFNPRKRLKLPKNVGVHPSRRKNLN